MRCNRIGNEAKNLLLSVTSLRLEPVLRQPSFKLWLRWSATVAPERRPGVNLGLLHVQADRPRIIRVCPESGIGHT